MPLENEVVTVRAGDLETVLSMVQMDDWPSAYREPVQRVHLALHNDRRPAADAAAPEPEEAPHPPGRWGRVELPGYRTHTGWLADELRFGQQVIVVRGWDGGEVANVIIGPACQVFYLPTPLRRPGAVAALPAGGDDVWEAETVDDDVNPEADF